MTPPVQRQDPYDAIFDVFAQPLLTRLLHRGVEVRSSGGNCPVQIEGTVQGTPFYFRARGSRWALHIGKDAFGAGKGCWVWEQPYGTLEFGAGWMSEVQAYKYILHTVPHYLRYRDFQDGK